MDIIIKEELVCTDAGEIAQLLVQAFPDFPAGKTHTNQIPSFRLLCRAESQKLVGHIAVHYRLMTLGERSIKVFGCSDVCVEASAQNQGVAKNMIHHLEQVAKSSGIDFFILIAWNTAVYEALGYQASDNPCRWLIMQNNQSLGLAQRSIPQGLMIKPLGKKKWTNELLDFLGPIF